MARNTAFTGRSNRAERRGILLAAAIAVATGIACGPATTAPPAKTSGAVAREAGGETITRGGAIVVSMHTDPRTFNRYLSQDVSSDSSPR